MTVLNAALTAERSKWETVCISYLHGTDEKKQQQLRKQPEYGDRSGFDPIAMIQKNLRMESQKDGSVHGNELIILFFVLICLGIAHFNYRQLISISPISLNNK